MKECPTYDFNLDLPSEKRWNAILSEFDLKTFAKEMDQVLADLSIGSTSLMVIRNLMYRYQQDIMYLDEMKSIASRMNLDLEKVFVLQLCYEACACTTLITETKDGPCFLRTMDWDLPFLKKYTIQLSFRRKGRVLFHAPTWIGCVGVFTAFNPQHGLGAAINYRRTQNSSLWYLMTKVYRLCTRKWPVSYLVRDCFEKEMDIKSLRHRLTHSSLVAPCYMTIFSSHIDSSFVLTRGVDASQIRQYDKKVGGLIQTNCDDDKTEPNILDSIGRRKVCRDILKQVSGKSKQEVQDLFLKKPIVNPETIYYTLMDQSCKTWI